jgi:hypothetical protein
MFEGSELEAERKSSKPIEEMVGAIGFESTIKRILNDMQASGWHLRP